MSALWFPSLVAFVGIAGYLLMRHQTKRSLDKRLQNALTLSRENLSTAREVRKLHRSPLVGMLGKRLGQRLQGSMPSAKLAALQARLVQAGLPQMRIYEWLGIRVGLGLAIAVFMILYRSLIGFDQQMIIQPLAGGMLGYLLPNIWLGQRIKARHAEIQRMLPFTLDLIRICIQAGLDLSGALRRVVDKIKGPLSDEFNRMLYEVKMGKSRDAALADLSKRVGLAELSSFITILIQAEKYGMSIGSVIETQADQMRLQKSQRIRTKAAKIPVLMLIPIVLFIFPTIFMVLLGPAYISLSK
jgi:tight adherence protein C